MNKNVINLLKDKNYIMPSYLLKNYKKIGLTSDLFVLVCYLINLDNPIVCDYKRFSNDLNIEQLEVMNMINVIITSYGIYCNNISKRVMIIPGK